MPHLDLADVARAAVGTWFHRPAGAVQPVIRKSFRRIRRTHKLVARRPVSVTLIEPLPHASDAEEDR